MVDHVDPDVAAEVKGITDRFIRLGTPTQQHRVRVKLGPKRHILDQLVQEQVLATEGGNYLPRVMALDLVDEQIRKLCCGYTEVVLKACKQLYLASGAREYTIAQIEDRASADIGRPVDAQMIRVGAWFALDLRRYFSSWGTSPQGAVARVTLTEEIIDFVSLDTAWMAEKMQRLERKLHAEDAGETPRPTAEVRQFQEASSAMDFSFVKSDPLRHIVERDYAELQRVSGVQAPKSRLVLAGGLIEALLLDALEQEGSSAQNSQKAGKYKGIELDEWPLSTLIDVAVELRLIQSTTHKFSDAVRDLRNLVHPGKEVRQNFSFGEEEANIANQVLEIVIRDLKKRAAA